MPDSTGTVLKTTQTRKSKGIDLDDFNAVNRKNILVVDDECENITLLKRVFMNEGYNVSGAKSGQEALDKIRDVNPAIVILDLLMPEMNGEETLKAIQNMIDVPVIMLSAVDERGEIIRMLHKGVDDYVTKPFDESELLARVEAVLRRSERAQTSFSLNFPSIELVINVDTYEVIFQNTRIPLTGKMFDVLELLAKNAPKVVNYQDLTQKIWGENSPSVRNRLKYLVYLLRQEFLKIDPQAAVIENIDRLGYKLSSEK